MTNVFAWNAAAKRAAGEALIREADNLDSQNWNEPIWADGEPIDPSPTVDRAINGGFLWLQIECSRCRTPRDIDLAALGAPATTFVHYLAGQLRRQKCAKSNKRLVATLLQLAPMTRNLAYE